MSMKGHRVSHRKHAALHADHGCRYSTRPVLGEYVVLDGAAAKRACKLPACKARFALALVDAAQAVNDATASSPRRWAVETRLADARNAALPADVRAAHDQLAARIRATMARTGAYLPTAA
jgi:hypothetical protein